MKDRSLDDFLSAGGTNGENASESAADEPSDGVTTDADATADDDPTPDTGATPDADATSDADPATPTMRFVRSGTCPACGAATTRLWRDGERFVCADCKEF